MIERERGEREENQKQAREKKERGGAKDKDKTE